YDANNNQNLTVDANGQRADLTYDYLDRLSTATFSQFVNPALDFQAQSINYTYDANSNLIARNEVKRIRGNNVAQQYLFSFDRLVHVVHHTGAIGAAPTPANLIASFDYIYDGNGNRVSQSEAHAGIKNGAAQPTTYSYDLLNRLSQATYGPAGVDGQITYTYQ